MEDTLPPLNCFLIPGGHPSAALAQFARTVCRRAERHVVRLFGSAGGREAMGRENGCVLRFLNRLSDYLFVLARFCNHLCETAEILWYADRLHEIDPFDLESTPFHPMFVKSRTDQKKAPVFH